MNESTRAKAIDLAVAIKTFSTSHALSVLARELIELLEGASIATADVATDPPQLPPDSTAVRPSTKVEPRSASSRPLSMTSDAVRARRRRESSRAGGNQLTLPSTAVATVDRPATTVATVAPSLSLFQDDLFRSPERGQTVVAVATDQPRPLAVPTDPPIEAHAVFLDVCEKREVELDLQVVWAKFSQYVPVARKRKKLGWMWQTTDQMLVMWRWWVGVERPFGRTTGKKTRDSPPRSQSRPRLEEPMSIAKALDVSRMMAAGNLAGAVAAATLAVAS